MPYPTLKPKPVIITPPLLNEDILLAQEAAEDRRLHARAQALWPDTQAYSCAEDNETVIGYACAMYLVSRATT